MQLISDDKDEVISGVNGKRVTFTDVLRVREFRVMWLADAQSSAGDQIGRVALSVLVFERTSSAVLTAVAYALTFLPALLGGALLSSLADRLPRRRVIVLADLGRFLMFGAMAIPRVPLVLICIFLVLAVLCEAPFTAAYSALTPTILPEHDLYVVGTGLRTITFQVAQLVGFVTGGALIALIGARWGLALNALTFLLSAGMIMIGVQARPAAQEAQAAGGVERSSLSTGLRLVFTSPKLRTLVGLVWLAGIYIVPEAVAAPYASEIASGALPVGLLMAAPPLGTALGTYLFVRWMPAVRPICLDGAAGHGVRPAAAGLPDDAAVAGLTCAVDAVRLLLLLPGTGDDRVRPVGARQPARPGGGYRLVRAACGTGRRGIARRLGGRRDRRRLGGRRCRAGRHAARADAFDHVDRAPVPAADAADGHAATRTGRHVRDDRGASQPATAGQRGRRRHGPDRVCAAWVGTSGTEELLTPVEFSRRPPSCAWRS